MSGDHFGTDIYLKAVPVIAEFCVGPCYVWFTDTNSNFLYKAVEEVGQIHALIIWMKNNATFNMNIHYKQKHEPCLYWKPKGSTRNWDVGAKAETLWKVERVRKHEVQPTQEPVA